jgi:hypothetical protein
MTLAENQAGARRAPDEKASCARTGSHILTGPIQKILADIASFDCSFPCEKSLKNQPVTTLSALGKICKLGQASLS